MGHLTVISNRCSNPIRGDKSRARKSLPATNLCWWIKVMYAPNVRWGDIGAECWRYEAQIKAIHILPRGRATSPAWLNATVTLMICYATLVAFGLLRAFDL